jgi:hypothetical protein
VSFSPILAPPLSVVKMRGRALPLSPWLGHEKEGEWVGQMQGQELMVM